MLDLLTAIAGGIALMSLLMVLLLVARRVWVARGDRRRRAREAVVRPVALALLDGEGEGNLEDLDRCELKTLGEVLLRYAPSMTGEALERITAFCERHGLVDRALGDLRGRRGRRRAQAAFDLGDMGSTRAGPSLLRALSDRSRDVRAAAVRSLGRLRLEAAAGPLVVALAVGSVPRAVAGRGLLELGPDAAPRLRELMCHEDPKVRAAAAELLGLVGEAADAPLFVNLLRDSSAQVRGEAAHALGRVGAESAVSQLRASLGDRIPSVRARAARALANAEDEPAGPLLLAQAQKDDFEPAHAAGQALRGADPELLREASLWPESSDHLLEAADLLALRGS